MAPRTFRTGPLLRTLACVIAFSAAAGIVALLGYDATHPSQESSELWASLGIAGFLALLLFACVGLLRSGFVLADDYLELVRPLGRTRLGIHELAGYGTMVLSVNHVPTFYVRLYRVGPAEIAKVPVAARDRREVEAWFAVRLPLVVDDGSLMQPRPRFPV